MKLNYFLGLVVFFGGLSAQQLQQKPLEPISYQTVSIQPALVQYVLEVKTNVEEDINIAEESESMTSGEWGCFTISTVAMGLGILFFTAPLISMHACPIMSKPAVMACSISGATSTIFSGLGCAASCACQAQRKKENEALRQRKKEKDLYQAGYKNGLQEGQKIMTPSIVYPQVNN